MAGWPFEKMQRLLAPVEQMCAGSEEFRDICDLFGKHKRALGEAWREKLAIDAQARALWQSLEDELLRLVKEVSSRELQRSLEEAESLSEATDYIVWSIFLFTLGLLAFLLVLLLLLRRDLLRPLVRIAGNLSRLRDGMQPGAHPRCPHHRIAGGRGHRARHRRLPGLPQGTQLPSGRGEGRLLPHEPHGQPDGHPQPARPGHAAGGSGGAAAGGQPHHAGCGPVQDLQRYAGTSGRRRLPAPGGPGHARRPARRRPRDLPLRRGGVRRGPGRGVAGACPACGRAPAPDRGAAGHPPFRQSLRACRPPSVWAWPPSRC